MSLTVKIVTRGERVPVLREAPRPGRPAWWRKTICILLRACIYFSARRMRKVDGKASFLPEPMGLLSNGRKILMVAAWHSVLLIG